MTDVKLANFRDLGDRYRADELVREVSAIFEMRPDQRAWITRHHSEKWVDDPDQIRFRDKLDQLLSYYSIVEVANFVRFLPRPLPNDFVNHALEYLRDFHIRQYYENHYPLVLPQLLRERLLSKQDIADDEDLKSSSIFMNFVDANALLERNPQTELFLKLLDDFYIEGYSLDDVIQALNAPEVVLSHLSHPPERQSILDQSLHGFRIFFEFCIGFDHLLQETSDYPFLQSGMWHYHAYWFDIIADKVDRLTSRALQMIAGWPQDAEDEEPDAEEDAPSLEKVRAAFDRLLARPGYGSALREVILLH